MVGPAPISSPVMTHPKPADLRMQAHVEGGEDVAGRKGCGGGGGGE
jgi:hypothetical protein